MEVAVGVTTPPLPEASRSETTFCFGVQVKFMENLNSKMIKEIRTDGPLAQQEALLEDTEMKRTQALERLQRMIEELHEFVQSKVNIHKEIKSKTTGVTTALRRFKNLDEESQILQQHVLRGLRNKPVASPTFDVPAITISPSSETDMGSEADSDSMVTEMPEKRPGKRKQRTSPKSNDKLVKKKKDATISPEKNKKEPSAWQPVLSRQDKREQHRRQQVDQPLRKQKPSQQKQRQTKMRKPARRSEALIICPTDKTKYSEVLRRIKSGVPDDQVRSTVEKVRKTNSGNVLITLSKGGKDKGQTLRQTIAAILKDDAKVVSKEPEMNLEIRDLDETTEKADVLAALQAVAGDGFTIPPESIKSLRKAYGGTQIAFVTLATTTAERIIGERGRIRIGWVNCRIRVAERPTQCYKCWHFGHLSGQCKSLIDRSKLCIKCGQEGHKVAECKNAASCSLCVMQGSKDTAHHAGTSRCPLFKEALQKLKNRRT